MNKSELTAQVKSLALGIGFDLVGITKAEVIPEAREHYYKWLEHGYQADMDYMSKDPERRSDPALVLDGAKSIIMLGINYYQEDPVFPANTGRVARYARGRDYHKYLDKLLKRLCRQMHETVDGEFSTKFYVDYGPFLERAYAEKAGIGFIGKNANVISREFGSYIFLSEVITSLELDYDKPHNRLCGTCTACLDACPTKAIREPYWIDANRCIPFHTIESKRENIPDQIAKNMQDRLFGCDICQEVCPHNILNAKQTQHEVFTNNATHFLPINEVLDMTEEVFNTRFVGSPLKRTKLKGLKRNAKAIQSS